MISKYMMSKEKLGIMKRKYSRFTATALSFMFAVSSILMSASAATLPEKTVIDPSSGMVEEINLIFNNQDSYTIIDSSGNDITQHFYNLYSEDYKNGDYQAIGKALWGYQATIISPVVTEVTGITFEQNPNSIMPRMILDCTATRTYVRTLSSVSTVTLYVAGDYRIYDTTGKIESASPPRSTGYDETHGLRQDVEVVQNSPSVTISPDRSMVTFRCDWVAVLIDTSFQVPIASAFFKDAFTVYV